MMTKGTPPVLATIGYEGAAVRDFIATLEAAGVATLIDVRAAPYSQRAEFRKKELEKSLTDAGLRYIHIHAFGAPPDARAAGKAGDADGYKRAFARHMQSQAFQNALIEIGEIVEAGGACLMCLERDPKRCHRAIVAAVLADVAGVRIAHLTVRARDQLALPLGK